MVRNLRDTISPEERVRMFDYAFDHAPIGIAYVDTAGRILRGNKSFCQMIGLPEETVCGVAFRDFTHPDDIDADLRLFAEVLSGERAGYTMEKRYIRPDGDVVHVRLNIIAMRNEAGEVTRFISQIEDVSEQKRIERQLAERAAQLELAVGALRGGFWHMDVETHTFQTSERLAQFIAGPQASHLDLEQYLSRIREDDAKAADLSALLAGEVDQSIAEYRLMTTGGERWMRCDRRLLRDTDGRPLRIVGVAIDLTEEHQRLEAVRKHAETDMLTGLLNRRGLRTAFEAMQSGSGYGLLVVDLDGFKTINDCFGHPAGDAVLVSVARRLVDSVRSGDVVSRTGGDEFVVLIPGSAEIMHDIAARIVEAVGGPITFDTGRAQVSASIGGTWSAGRDGSVDEMVAMADRQLYAAKAAGKNTWRVASRR